MKRLNLFMLLASIVMAAGLVSCDSDKEIDENGNTVLKLEKYFSTEVTRCERVGSVLQVEFTLKSLKEGFQRVELSTIAQGATDNLKSVYSYEISVNGSDFHWTRNFSIDKEGEAYVIVKFKDFDPNNKATKASFTLQLEADGQNFNSNKLTIKNQEFTDNRVLTNGVQTCDTRLNFRVDKSERVGSVLMIDFSITNYAERDIQRIEFSTVNDGVTDNLNNSYRAEIALAESDYHWTRYASIARNSTVKGHIKVYDYDPSNKASSTSVVLSVSCNDILLSDEKVRFISIPFYDNRVMNNGVQTPDVNLQMNVASCKIINEDRDALVEFTMQNLTDQDMRDVTLSTRSGGCRDNNNNTYTYTLSVDGEDTHWTRKLDIMKGTTGTAYILVKGLRANSRSLSVELSIESSNYIFADNVVRFINVPVEY